jgi:predicted ATPase/class 3 adenylate cyclase
MLTPLELAQFIAAYVPADVASRALGGAHDAPRPGETIPVKAAVLFADVAGFTPMSERLALLGPLGTEELARILNETFTALIVQIGEHGGIVARFSGDALTAFFLCSPDLPPSETVTRALACAQAMQRAMIAQMSHVQAGGQTFDLSIKIGAGYGPAALLAVGDGAHGMEHVLAGAALDWAVGGEKCAHAGQVVVHASMLALAEGVQGETCGEYVVLSPLSFVTDHSIIPRGAFPLHTTLGQDVGGAKSFDHAEPGPSASLRVTNQIEGLSAAGEAELEAFIKTCAPFLPRSVYARLLAEEGDLAGEHRRVTSMFVNFTGLHYDYPAAGDQLQAYVRAMQDVVAQFEGHLNRVLTGDKGSALHILFGAPDAHEDDLFRALRCALALQAEVTRLPFITDQRIGIASGVVFAGPVGSAARREYTVIGDMVNLSSRLTFTCDPGCILVDAYTRDRTAQRFTYEARPPMRLKGKAEPVRAFRLLAERASEAGLAARYLASRWPLVGRADERADLVRAADRALAGQGCTVAISGGPGVGKTRLVEEVVRHWLAAGGNGYSGECLSHGLNVPYLPWNRFLSAFFDMHESDSPEEHWRQVERTVTEETPEMSAWVGVLAPLLGLSAPASPASLLGAAERRRKLFEVVTALLRARASRVPLLLLFEDIHWADQSSLDLLDHVAARIHDVPLSVCLSFRTPVDLKLDVLASPDCTWKELGELGEKSAEELVRAILGEAGPSPQVAQLARDIHVKTLGNPLFVEEILNSLIESGVLVRDDGQYHLMGDATQVQIPDSLQSLLMARLDLLEPPTRDLTQVASVIGQHFAYIVLRGVYPYPMADTAMRERLDTLAQADFTRLERPDPELSYLFKHALTYEVAYNCLPFARRRELHARVGEFLEWLYRDHPEEICGVLARHWERGQKWNKAIVTALMAGTLAQDLYANQEALAFYQLAEQCLGHLPAASFWINALRLHLNRGRLHRRMGQYAAAEADLHRALDLAREHQDTRAQAEAYNSLAESYWWQSRNIELLDASRQAYDIARENGHTAEMAVSTRSMGLTYQTLGEWEHARTYLDEAYRLAEEQQNEPLLATVLTDLATNRVYAGELDDALSLFQRALEIRQRIGLKDKIASTLVNMAVVHQRRGDLVASLEAFRQAIALAREIGSGALPYSLLSQAEVEAHAGHYDAARELCEESQRVFAARGDATGLAWVKFRLGRNVYLELEQDDLAWPALEDALVVMRASESHEEIIQALAGLGALALRAGDNATARRHLDEAQQLCESRLLSWALVETLIWQGRLALAEGRDADAESQARAALDLIERHGYAGWRDLALDLLAQCGASTQRRTGRVGRGA